MTEEGIRFKKDTAVRTASAKNWLGTKAESKRKRERAVSNIWRPLGNSILLRSVEAGSLGKRFVSEVSWSKQSSEGSEDIFISRIRTENLDFSQFHFFIVLSKMTYTDDPPFDNREGLRTQDQKEKSVFQKERKGRLFSQPIQVEISMLGTDPSRKKIVKSWAGDMS